MKTKSEQIQGKDRAWQLAQGCSGRIQYQALIGALAGFLLVGALGFTGWVVVKKGVFSRSSASAQSATLPKLNEAEIIMGETMREQGLHHVAFHDAKVIPTNRLGYDCVQLINPGEKYLYFALDPSVKLASDLDVRITIEFLAPISGSLFLQYDGHKAGPTSLASVYSQSSVGLQYQGSQRWHRVTLEAHNARFENRQNGKADFRLRVFCPEFYVRRVTVTDIEIAREATPDQGTPGRSALRYER